MRIKNSLTNISTGLIGQFLVLITGFVVRTVFIKNLGSTYLGVSGLFSNVLTILSFAELGIGQAIIYSLYKPIANNNTQKIANLMDLYKKVYKIIFFVVLVVGLAIIPILPYIIKDIDTIPYIRIIYIMYVFDSSFSYLFIYKATLLTATQRNHILNKVNALTTVLVSILQIFILVTTKNYFIYLSIQIISKLIQNIFLARKTDKLYPYLKEGNYRNLEISEINSMKKNVSALILYKIGTLSLNSTDNMIMSAFIGIKAVGIYSNYNLIVSSVSGFLSTIFSNITASIGNLNASDDDEKKYFMFKVINLATFWLYGVVSVCFFSLANSFIGSCWIGENYLLDMSVVFVISINIYISGMLYAPFNYRQTMGLFVQGKYRPIISAIENIIVSIFLAKYIGIAGVLWGTVITRLTTNAWYDPYLVYKKGLKQNPMKYIVDYIIKFVILLITMGICFIFISNINIKNILEWLVIAICVFIISNAIFFIYSFRSKEFKYLFNVFKNIISIRKRGV